jgi:class 3 adenylate cyclase
MAKVEIPETHYAHNGPVNLAYQTVGDGPISVLLLKSGITHLDYFWQYPPVVRFIERFASFSRFVMFDKRGCGLSDRTVEPPTIAEDVSDVVAVLDHLGIERAHLFGEGDGGAAALALAAAHPDRVTKVAVIGAVCCVVATEDFPWGIDPVEAEAIPSAIESEWGGTDLLEAVAPNYADDPVFARWFTGMNRAGVSPAGAAAWIRNLIDVDIRPILGDVAAPVLVTDRADAQFIDPGQSRYLAEHLPDARHVEFPGEDYLMWVGDTDAVVDEVEEFFTGTRPTHAPTRALATVMFTDIVGSTGRAADMGDDAWRALLARHDDLTRHRVQAHDGRVVKSTGDGALAAFDDPENAIAAAQSLIADLNASDIEIRVGIHFGQIEITGDDVAGIAVHLAARISGLAGPGDIYVSGTVRDLLLGSDIEFDDRGTHDLKGIPGTWNILAVVNERLLPRPG